MGRYVVNMNDKYLWNAHLATDVVVQVVSAKIAKEDWLRVGGGVGRVHGRLECHARSSDRRDDKGGRVCGVGGGSDEWRAKARYDATCYSYHYCLDCLTLPQRTEHLSSSANALHSR